MDKKGQTKVTWEWATVSNSTLFSVIVTITNVPQLSNRNHFPSKANVHEHKVCTPTTGTSKIG